MNPDLRKLAGACGVATFLVFPMILTAIQLSPWFSWYNNALSDLGVDGVAATIFNSSLILGGVLSFVFSLGVKEVMPRRLASKVGVLFLMLSALSLTGIGIFPENAGRIHSYFSVAFFVLLALSLLTNGVSLLHLSKKLGWLTILLGVVSTIVWGFPHRGVAIPEFVAALSGSIWSTVLGFRMLE